MQVYKLAMSRCDDALVSVTSGGKELSFGYLFLLIWITTFYGTLHPFGSHTQPNEHHSPLVYLHRSITCSTANKSVTVVVANKCSV